MKFQPLHIAVIVSFLLSCNEAFTPSLAVTSTRPTIVVAVRNSKHTDPRPEHVVGVTRIHHWKELLLYTATAIAFTVTPIQPVSASPTFSDFDRLPTIQIAETVKELDFSLPSYDDIKSYKASAETVQSLTVQPKPFDPKTISLRTSSSSDDKSTADTASDDSTSATSLSSSNPLSSVLPSLSKKGPKQKASYDGYTF